MQPSRAMPPITRLGSFYISVFDSLRATTLVNPDTVVLMATSIPNRFFCYVISPIPLLFNYNINIAQYKKLSTSKLKKSFSFSEMAGVGWENNLDPIFHDGAMICVAIFLRSVAQPFRPLYSIIRSMLDTVLLR